MQMAKLAEISSGKSRAAGAGGEAAVNQVVRRRHQAAEDKDQAMFEWMLGILVLAIVIAAVLAFFELIDLFDPIGGVLKLTAGLLFAVGAFFAWLVTRRRSEKAGAVSDVLTHAAREAAQPANHDVPFRSQLNENRL
jgi:hypothetical protein